MKTKQKTEERKKHEEKSICNSVGHRVTPRHRGWLRSKRERSDPPKPDDSKPEQSEQVEQTDGEKELKKLGLLTYSLGEEFGVDILHGAQAAGEKLGYTIIAPDPSGDLQKQIAQLEDLVQQKVDAVMIAPIDAYAIVPHLQDALNKGVPIINYDIIADMDECNAVIKCDNYDGGVQAGKEIVNRIGTEGKVLILEDNPGVVVIEQRCQGVEDYIKEHAPDVVIVKQLSNGPRDVHQRTTENMLTAHPDLSAIFAPDGDHTLGAYAACKQMGRDEVRIVGYDASPEQIDIMKEDGPDGILAASVAQFPIMMGRICVETADKFLNGGDTSAHIC